MIRGVPLPAKVGQRRTCALTRPRTFPSRRSSGIVAPLMAFFLRKLRSHVALGALAAMLVGAVDVALAARSSSYGSAASALWLGAALLLPLALPLGMAAWVLEQLLVRRGALPWVSARLREPTAPWRLPLLAAGALTVAAGAAMQSVYVRAALALQDDGYAGRLSSFVFVVALVSLGVLLLVLAAGLRWLGTWLAAKGSPGLRALAVCSARYAVLAAAIAWLAVFIATDAQLLGALVVLPYAAVLALVWLGLALSPLAARVSALSARRGPWLGAFALLCTAAPLQSAVFGWRDAVVRSVGPAAVSGVLAQLTDVDRDGQSGLFGGADCAPFDGARGPLAFDMPGNRIDEDCDGRDARALAGGTRALAENRPEILLPPALVRRYNVVLLVVDALRADRVGRARTLTPEIDRLAREGVSFTRAYSQGPSTRISYPSFLTGLWPANVRFERRAGLYQMSATQESLATTLRGLGYRNSMVINAWMKNHLPGVRRGYDQTLNTRVVDGVTIDSHHTGPSSTTRGIEVVEAAAREPSRPFFLTLYYDGPHSPYDDLREFGFPARSLKPADRYDAEIRYVDAQVGRFIDHLRMKPSLWANTVVIVTADHGEEFGEHGGAYHDRTCYGESTHVPLIVRVPGLAMAVAPSRVALVDIVPTVYALLGVRTQRPLDGRNLLRATADRYAHEPDARTYCAFFLDRDPVRTQWLAVRDERWFATRRIASGAMELYDTKLDPQERNNLVQRGAPAELVARYRSLLLPMPFVRDSRRPMLKAVR